jgi:hypothetical protein
MNSNIIYCVIAVVIVWYVFVGRTSKKISIEAHKSCPLVDYQEDINEFSTATARSHLQERATRIKKAVAECQKLDDCPLKEMQKQVWNFHNNISPHASSQGPITGIESGVEYASLD